MYLTEADGVEYGVKPMNCPGHAHMFASRRHSYRDLPVRYADFGRLHRYEPSGATAGLTRVRSFAQDDAHVFCRVDQISDEIAAFARMLTDIYQLFGFDDVQIALSTRPEKAVGSLEVWARAEQILADTLDAMGVEYRVDPGEGAFYGPKIDFTVADALGRRHQLATCQLDFNMPERFGLEYITADDGRERPVMIHRAILGSLERFIGVLIEHTGGVFPAWLAPVQVAVVPIAQRHEAYAEQVRARLFELGYRVELRSGEERMNARIAAAEAHKIPYMLVCGDREAATGAVAVRERGMVDHGAQSLAEFEQRLASTAAFPPL
jgi:threonyl-tRNA synthetase